MNRVRAAVLLSVFVISALPLGAFADAADAGVPLPAIEQLPDPCAGADGGFPKLDVSSLPDGGPALPQAICEGQTAPAPGVFLTVPRAAELAAERDADAYTIQAQKQALTDQQKPLFSTSATIVGTVALGIGVVGGILIGVFFRPVQK